MQFYRWVGYKGGTPLLDAMDLMNIDDYAGCNSSDSHLTIKDKETGLMYQIHLKLGDWIILKNSRFYRSLQYFPRDQITQL